MGMGFVDALGIARRGLDKWASEPHNKRWWKRIDGTPIPNDLTVRIAEEFASHSGAREWPDGRIGPDDDGAMSIAVAIVRGRIIMRFSQPTEWIGFDADSARTMIDNLAKKLEDIDAAGQGGGE
jgi:hypothetical protein